VNEVLDKLVLPGVLPYKYERAKNKQKNNADYEIIACFVLGNHNEHVTDLMRECFLLLLYRNYILSCHVAQFKNGKFFFMSHNANYTLTN
jgi:hypothetical protein